VIVHIPLQFIAIRDDGFHLMVNVSVNGHPLRMLVDTGASRTVFDRQTLSTLLDLNESDIFPNEGPSGGIGTSELESSITLIRELSLGECSLKDYMTALIDLGNVHQLYDAIGLIKIDGILGGDLLMETKAVIDYKKARLTLRCP